MAPFFKLHANSFFDSSFVFAELLKASGQQLLENELICMEILKRNQKTGA